MAEAKKAEGNAFFKAGKYPEAVAKYSEALALDDTMHTVFSNRAACYEKMKVRRAVAPFAAPHTFGLVAPRGRGGVGWGAHSMGGELGERRTARGRR